MKLTIDNQSKVDLVFTVDVVGDATTVVVQAKQAQRTLRQSNTFVSVCPFCGEQWAVMSDSNPLFIWHCKAPTYNHSRGDSELTPCPQCERPWHCAGSGTRATGTVWLLRK